MIYGNEKYLIVFVSSYHGYYMEEMLRRNGVKNTLRKAPKVVGRSCQTAIYIHEEDFDKTINLIMKAKLRPNGVYEIIRNGSMVEYKKLETKSS